MVVGVFAQLPSRDERCPLWESPTYETKKNWKYSWHKIQMQRSVRFFSFFFSFRAFPETELHSHEKDTGPRFSFLFFFFFSFFFFFFSFLSLSFSLPYLQKEPFSTSFHKLSGLSVEVEMKTDNHKRAHTGGHFVSDWLLLFEFRQHPGFNGWISWQEL